MSLTVIVKSLFKTFYFVIAFIGSDLVKLDSFAEFIAEFNFVVFPSLLKFIVKLIEKFLLMSLTSLLFGL